MTLPREQLMAASDAALQRLARSLGIAAPETIERGKLVTKIRARMKRQRAKR